MSWVSIRDFLNLPIDITGKGINIAVIDFKFAIHPEIISNERRDTYLIKTYQPHPKPIKLSKTDNDLKQGLHGLWTASSAAGSGELSKGYYSGAAPDANLYLIEMGLPTHTDDYESLIRNGLNWIKENGLKYRIRGIVLTSVGQLDTGLLPWQCDPIRILCEEISDKGILVVSSSGNNHEITCGSIVSPSVLSVGGVIIPKIGRKECALPFPGSRGVMFDGKWNPSILAPASNVVLPFPFESKAERLEHYTALQDNLPDDYARQWGTSYGAPIVLGLAACVWQMNPECTADEMKEILISSSYRNDNWNELRTGLVSGDAIKQALAKRKCKTDKNTEYLIWKKYKTLSLPEKIIRINEKDSEVLHILLSFLPNKLPHSAVRSVIKCLSHESPLVRTAAIIVLSTNPENLSVNQLKCSLEDRSPYVRMGGIYALRVCPKYWEELSPDVCNLINDENPDIRYNASKLASVIKNNIFIKAIIKNLEQEARQKNVGIFGQKVSALEAICNYEIKREPKWREGEKPYSDRNIEALVLMAQRWKAYLRV